MGIDLTGSIRRSFAITRNTVFEGVRNRAFLGMGIAAFGLIVTIVWIYVSVLRLLSLPRSR